MPSPGVLRLASSCLALLLATTTLGCGEIVDDVYVPEPDMAARDLAIPLDAQVVPDLTSTPDMAKPAIRWCDLPGSVQFTANGVVKVPGGPMAAADLSFMKLPAGFCAHWFGHLGNPRQLRFAPGGEAFVASPTRLTTGGDAAHGLSAIVVLPDDDHDGVADAPVTFLSGIAATQGIAFADGAFYYQDDTKILRMPYRAGDRKPSANATQIADSQIYKSSLHWPKPIDVADDGTVYVGNGGDQGDNCDPLLSPAQRPFHGGILKLDGSMGGKIVARGFRNPIGLRCPRGKNRCFAVELAQDYSAMQGGREKLVPIRDGDDWGYPCCATRNLPHIGINPAPDCSSVQAEDGSFVIGDTPMTVDFAPSSWPAPWGGSAIVPLHGAFATWVGARVVAIGVDPMTGLPLPGTDLQGMSTGAMRDFATGWDDFTRTHGRPDAVAFSDDGRMFLTNDENGEIIWIAPIAK